MSLMSKVATADLRTSNGTLAFAAGDEVPDHVLDSELAKANGWADLVASPKSKSAAEAKSTSAVPAAK